MKKKILICSDHPSLASGYSNIIRNIFYELSNKYEIKMIGKDLKKNLNTPFDIIGQSPHDETGRFLFDKITYMFKPDIVIIIGDFWDILVAETSRFRNTFKLISHIAVDGSPLPKTIILPHFGLRDVAQILFDSDVLVTYTNFGKEEILKLLDKNKCVKQIPAGIDFDIFNTKTNIGKTEFDNVFQSENFVTIDICRNFTRKALYRNFQVLSLLKNQKISHIQYSELQSPKGWFLPELSRRYAVQDKVSYPQKYDIYTNQKDPKYLATLLNQSNLFIRPSLREGFGLPNIEAMACNLPVLVPNYGPILDYLPNPEYQTIAIREYVPTPVSSIMDALIDINDFKNKIQWFINNPNETKQIGIENSKAVNVFSWDNIRKLWIETIDKLTITKKMQKNNIIIV